MTRVMRLLLVGAALFAAAACDKTSNPNDDGGGALDLAFEPDFAMGGPAGPTCMSPPGIPACSSGTTFQSSPTSSGCFPNGTTPPGAFNPPYDTPMGPCTGDLVIQCANSPNCSFCINANAAIPPGCSKQ